MIAMSWSRVVGFGVAGALGVAACGDAITEHSPTKAVIQNVSGWQTAQLTGVFDSPDYPVSVPYVPFSQPFSGTFLGNAWPTIPHPLFRLYIKIFGNTGPAFPESHFHQWVEAPYSNDWAWASDPEYPQKQVARPFGNYTVGWSGGIGPRYEIAYAFSQIDYGSGSPTGEALGKASLPWKYSSEGSNIVGTGASVPINTQFWVQATASLPGPITYSWTVNGAPQSWNGSLVATSYTTIGAREFVATMTGADNSQVVRSWSVNITCPPPYEEYIVCP